MTIGCLGSKLQKKLNKSVKLQMKELGFHGLKDFCLRYKNYFEFKDEFAFNPLIKCKKNENDKIEQNLIAIWSYKDELRYINFWKQCKNDPILNFENGTFSNHFDNKVIKPEC
ncbi:hypothetical protein MHBO_001650 [Bonamia ostreae]|uniref:LAGLIDADG homing endonuclease n=1 Tax=Bonamia ostreae TaxID=126728 RepID=A0ABV2AKB6_9EUKA